jgi:hypothetical protein
MTDTQLQFCIPRSKCYLALFHFFLDFSFLLLKKSLHRSKFSISGKSSVLGTLSSRKYCQQILCQGRKTAKTVLKTAKTAKIHFCRQKFSNFYMDQFSPFGLNFVFFFLKKSSDCFKSTYKTKKKKNFFFDVKLLTTNRTTALCRAGPG